MNAPPSDLSKCEAVSRLAELPLFASLAPDALASIEPHFSPQTFPREGVIFFEGEPPRWLHVILRGHVKLIKHSEDGRDIILHLAMPGDLIGGVAAFGRRPHPFTATAMVETATLRVAGTDFGAIMDAHPQVARRTIDELCVRLIEAHEMMKSLAIERVERRIARQLLKLAEQASHATPLGPAISIPLSRQDVADLAGTTVETAIRVLSRWRRSGWVQTVDGLLVIVHADRLAEIVADPGGL